MKAALLPIAFALTAGAAFAEGPLQGNEVFNFQSQLTRAEVQAPVAPAYKADVIARGEASPSQAQATVVASGRSDFPNQINNVLAFPGVFRGLLDARAKNITTEMLLRAAEAIAHVVTDEQLNPTFIIPSVFNPDVPKAVAAAIRGDVTD